MPDNKEAVLKEACNGMPINRKVIMEILGKNSSYLLSARYPNKNRPVMSLSAEASIPPEDDYKTSLPLRVLFLGQAMKEAIELLDVLNNFGKEKFAILLDKKDFYHTVVCGFVKIKTALVVEKNGISIKCRSEQDGKVIGKRTLEFSRFEAGLPMRDFL